MSQKAKSKPKRSSEKAWVDKRCISIKDTKNRQVKLSFLEFARYYRWYTIDSRSVIMRRIHPIRPDQYFNNDYWWPRWPRLVR